MDGSTANDWTSRSGIEEKHLASFAMSYGVCVGADTTQQQSQHDFAFVVDTCAAADSAVTNTAAFTDCADNKSLDASGDLLSAHVCPSVIALGHMRRQRLRVPSSRRHLSENMLSLCNSVFYQVVQKHCLCEVEK